MGLTEEMKAMGVAPASATFVLNLF